MKHRLKVSAFRALNGLQLCLLLFITLLVGGCQVGGPYQLKGLIVAGPKAELRVVSKNDPLLKQSGVSDATLIFYLDPSSISPKHLGKQISDLDGQFELQVNAMGAGSWQMYQLGVQCHAKGYADIWQTIQLPRRGQTLLIVMAPGRGGKKPPSDIVKETLRYKDQF